MAEINPKEFWEQKILGWEKGRYETATQTTIMEKLADRLSSSLRFRLQIAGSILSAHVSKKRIVELGCGSGYLAERLIEAGAESYLGIDITEAAVKNASDRVAGSAHKGRISFQACDLSELATLNADVVFSLGLLDWLTLQQIDKLFSMAPDADFLHAISERRISLSQMVHRAYVHLSYGWRTNQYVPLYYTVGEMATIIHRYSDRPINVYRDRCLSFGTLVTSFPVPK